MTRSNLSGQAAFTTSCKSLRVRLDGHTCAQTLPCPWQRAAIEQLAPTPAGNCAASVMQNWTQIQTAGNLTIALTTPGLTYYECSGEHAAFCVYMRL